MSSLGRKLLCHPVRSRPEAASCDLRDLTASAPFASRETQFIMGRHGKTSYDVKTGTGVGRNMNRMAMLILTATVSAPALACQPLKRTEFENIAPGARNILVFRIESLELNPEPSDALELHKIKGKIRVLRKYRESGDDFQWLTFTNTICHGRRLDVGGIYLIATNSSPPLIELAPADESILELSGAYPFNPDYLLRASPTIKGLLAALSGNGDFKLSTKETTLRMQRELPPPEVPPPEGLCPTLTPCNALPTAPAPAEH